MAFTPSRILRKISKVPTRDVLPSSALVYSPRYSVPRRMTLSTTFDVVTDKNRFTSLRILLDRLSGHVGRRQYKMQCDLAVYLERFKEAGIDWHEVKAMSPDDLRLLCDEVLKMTPAERSVFLTAVHAKVCGVLRRSETRHSTFICMNHGKAEFGWRCGLLGHTNDVYFEGKQRANPATLQLHQRPMLRHMAEDGVRVDVRSEPDFSVVGRLEHPPHPRVWSTPTNPTFDVTVIGIEFRVHPDDPRATAQIENSAHEWELHAAVVKQVLWELLEMNAVERESQPLELVAGDLGQPDNPLQYSTAFTTKVKRQQPVASEREANARATGSSDESSISPEDVFVEQRFTTASGEQHPWFREPLPQRFARGVPEILPFTPTIVIRSTFRQIVRESETEDLTAKLSQPVMDVACLVHPDACFWWNKEEEDRCIAQLVDYAKRIPFALPFNMYIRVDPSRVARDDPTVIQERERLMNEKRPYFDVRRFTEVYRRSASASGDSFEGRSNGGDDDENESTRVGDHHSNSGHSDASKNVFEVETESHDRN